VTTQLLTTGLWPPLPGRSLPPPLRLAGVGSCFMQLLKIILCNSTFVAVLSVLRQLYCKHIWWSELDTACDCLAAIMHAEWSTFKMLAD